MTPSAASRDHSAPRTRSSDGVAHAGWSRNGGLWIDQAPDEATGRRQQHAQTGSPRRTDGSPQSPPDGCGSRPGGLLLFGSERSSSQSIGLSGSGRRMSGFGDVTVPVCRLQIVQVRRMASSRERLDVIDVPPTLGAQSIGREANLPTT